MATGDGLAPDYLDSVNQQSLILECSICAENYGPDFDHQSRSLRCGHTFCTKCLMKIMTSRGVRCPMCNHPHNLSSPDVMLLPINYTVQEILKTVATNESVVERQPPDLPPCGVCHNPATVICVDCEPGNHFNFCVKCDNDEHGRPFGPVQRHRRFPIGDEPCPNSYAGCPRHPSVTASLFSESLNEFACNMCVTEEEWVSRSSQFDLIVEATKRLQGKVQKLTKHTTDIIRRMNGSKLALETILSNLEPATMEVKADITTQFSKLVEVLQERQRILLANVDVEHKNRRENVEIQLKVVVALTVKYRDAFESLNSLISKTDIEFLRFFPATTKHIESLLDSEDKSLLRPVVNQHIPFYINKDVEKEVKSLGAVGGGLTPTDLGYSPSGSQGSLLELFWQLPEHCGKLSRFQIEYDQMTVERRGSGMVMESDDFVYAQSEPQFYEVPGNKLNSYMDYLCPGYNYRFRIRSANDAGWGMWSKPILGKCEGFPFTLEYTKSIHRVVVPISSYYRITVMGAKGEDGMIRRGGKGAIISATFILKAGDILILLCGGMSSRHHYHSGGGGGSFLALNEVSQNTLLIAAGGGGGTRGASEEDLDGSDASIYPDGKDGLGEDAGKGGLNGASGEDARDKAAEGPSFGNGGAGFMQDSSTARSFLSGGHGGQNGGFGGGGAVGMYGGGGGGGYSGGGGGRGGGGGGSYVISTALNVTREVGNDKHGSVTIDRMAMPPYPISNIQGQTGSVSDLISTSDSTETSSSSQQMHPFPQMSSSSVGSGSNLTSNCSSKAISTASVGISIGMIPESSHESPASTNQVIDHARYVPATFSIGDPRGSNGNDDATIEIFSHGDGSSGVGGEDPSELDAPVHPGTRIPASVLSEFIPTLGEYLGSSQTTTAATTTTVAPGRVGDLINFNQQFLRETPDSTLMNKISPEDKALIAQHLIQQQPRKVYQSHSHVPLISAESNINPHSVKPSKSVMYQQQQQQPLMVGMSTSSPVRPTKHTASPSSGIGPPEQSTNSQSQLPMQQQFPQDHYQQQQAEMQRYIQSQQQKHQQTQASQHVQPQHLVHGGGQDDLSPPLTQQHVVMQHQQQLHQQQQQPAQLVSVHQPVSQHVQQQQLLLQQQQLQMQAGICDDNSQPLLVQQLVALASQSSIQPPNNGMEYSSPGQYGQQPSFDYTAHPNWNSKN